MLTVINNLCNVYYVISILVVHDNNNNFETYHFFVLFLIKHLPFTFHCCVVEVVFVPGKCYDVGVDISLSFPVELHSTNVVDVACKLNPTGG